MQHLLKWACSKFTEIPLGSRDQKPDIIIQSDATTTKAAAIINKETVRMQ